MTRFLQLMAVMLAAAAQPALTSGADVDITPRSSVIASPITARLSIPLAEGERARLPKKPPLPGQAELLETKSHPPVTRDDGSSVLVVEYVFLMYKTGKAEFPPVTYEIVKEDDSRQTFTTGPVSFDIVSVRTDPGAADQPVDIRPPVDMPFDWRRYLLPALALLAAAIIGALIWRRFSTGRKLAESEQGPPPVPPHLEAFDSLTALKNRDMFAHGQGQLYFFLLSDIMRKYVEGRYGAPALERTTDEFEREFDLRYERKEKRDMLIGLLRGCDIVKFANREATREEADRAFAQAWAWVEETMPRQPATPEKEDK